jgi:threonine synthase
LKKILKGYHYTDTETKKAIKEIHEVSGYIADPHGAVGYLGLKDFLKNTTDDYQGLFLETAHPIKFVDTVEATLKTTVEIPKRLESILNREKTSIPISRYDELKSFLLKR